MKRMIVTLGLGFLLALLAGPGWADGFHGGFHSGRVKVFIGRGHPFLHDRFFSGRRFFVDRPFFRREVIVPRFRSTVILNAPFVSVVPFPARTWILGLWQWTGFQWVWVPGH
jgi:hypothetical protein